MTNTNEIISKLKEVRKQKDLSYGDIIELMKKNGDYLSKSTISRVFQDDSENVSFRYEETIRPIARALLDIDTIEDYDPIDVQAMKSLLQYKSQRVSELEQEIEQLKITFEKEKNQLIEKADNERKHSQKVIELLEPQILRKDQQINTLLEALLSKDLRYDELWNFVLAIEKKGSEANAPK